MDAKAPLFIMVGGFLGAGKTTTVGRLARHYQAQGKRVIVVTNDQAADLVDTHTLRAQGLEVGEVAGSCFCCNFNELTSVMEKMAGSGLPDVVLAEPVGSCTDLVATVMRPLEKVYQKPMRLAPYAVILKPGHGRRILGNHAKAGFSPQAAYIFRKQLEEADLVLVNRADELKPDEVAELTRLVNEQFPGRPVLAVSAGTGAGFDQFIQALEQGTLIPGQRTMEVDYDIYAQGEADLGWLNSQGTARADSPFDLDTLALGLVRGIQNLLTSQDAETAHLKVTVKGAGAVAVANSIDNTTPPKLSQPAHRQATEADLIINARVALDPETLAQLVAQGTRQAAHGVGAVAELTNLRSFRPGRPVPTHRLVEKG
jgi:Ni2+-binding GTPase involved in maturation of urease and hydrogenase